MPLADPHCLQCSRPVSVRRQSINRKKERLRIIPQMKWHTHSVTYVIIHLRDIIAVVLLNKALGPIYVLGDCFVGPPLAQISIFVKHATFFTNKFTPLQTKG